MAVRASDLFTQIDRGRDQAQLNALSCWPGLGHAAHGPHPEGSAGASKSHKHLGALYIDPIATVMLLRGLGRTAAIIPAVPVLSLIGGGAEKVPNCLSAKVRAARSRGMTSSAR